MKVIINGTSWSYITPNVDIPVGEKVEIDGQVVGNVSMIKLADGEKTIYVDPIGTATSQLTLPLSAS